MGQLLAMQSFHIMIYHYFFGLSLLLKELPISILLKPVLICDGDDDVFYFFCGGGDDAFLFIFPLSILNYQFIIC